MAIASLDYPKRRKLIRAALSVLLIAGLIGAGFYFFGDRNQDAGESDEGVKEHYHSTPPLIDMKNGEALQEAKNNNPAVTGWIEVSGIDLWAPVVQTKDNDSYFAQNWKGEDDENGTYFYDSKCYVDYIEDLSPNVIIYGKNTVTNNENAEDNIRFGQLEKYLNKAFFEENNTILLTVGDYEVRYEIIGVGYMDMGADQLVSKANPTKEEFAQVLDVIKSINVHDTDFSTDGVLNIITLFAYTEGSTQGLAVIGKLVL